MCHSSCLCTSLCRGAAQPRNTQLICSTLQQKRKVASLHPANREKQSAKPKRGPSASICWFQLFVCVFCVHVVGAVTTASQSVCFRDERDQLYSNPDSKEMLVMRNGHFYLFKPVDSHGEGQFAFLSSHVRLPQVGLWTSLWLVDLYSTATCHSAVIRSYTPVALFWQVT